MFNIPEIISLMTYIGKTPDYELASLFVVTEYLI